MHISICFFFCFFSFFKFRLKTFLIYQCPASWNKIKRRGRLLLRGKITRKLAKAREVLQAYLEGGGKKKLAIGERRKKIRGAAVILFRYRGHFLRLRPTIFRNIFSSFRFHAPFIPPSRPSTSSPTRSYFRVRLYFKGSKGNIFTKKAFSSVSIRRIFSPDRFIRSESVRRGVAGRGAARAAIFAITISTHFAPQPAIPSPHLLRVYPPSSNNKMKNKKRHPAPCYLSSLRWMGSVHRLASPRTRDHYFSAIKPRPYPRLRSIFTVAAYRKVERHL